jgi:hypothetical protein
MVPRPSFLLLMVLGFVVITQRLLSLYLYIELSWIHIVLKWDRYRRENWHLLYIICRINNALKPMTAAVPVD